MRGGRLQESTCAPTKLQFRVSVKTTANTHAVDSSESRPSAHSGSLETGSLAGYTFCTRRQEQVGAQQDRCAVQ